MSSQRIVSVRDLTSSGITLSWQEALALAQSIIAINSERPPTDNARGTLDEFAIDGDGAVVAAAGQWFPVSMSAVAIFLETLLPDESAGADGRAPAGVHFAIGRALGVVGAPPFASLEDLSRSLARFEQDARPHLLRQVVERYLSLQGLRDLHVPTAKAPRPERRSGMRPDALRRLLRDTDRDAYRSRGASGQAVRQHGPDADMLRRLLREADERTFELTRSARRAPRPFTGLRIRLARGASRLAAPAFGRMSRAGFSKRDRTLAGIGILLIAAGAAAERQPLGRALSFVTGPPAPPMSARPAADPASPQAIPAVVGRDSRPPAGDDAARAFPRSVAGSRTSGPHYLNVDTAGTTGETTTGAPSLEPVPVLAEPSGRLIEALDVSKRPVFSASFGADRSALLDEEGGPATGGVVQIGSGGDGFVRVLSIAHDRGRNYHPRLSPDGRTIAFDSDRDGPRGVYLASRDGHEVRRVSGPEYAAFPAWSPDGTRLAFVRSEPDDPTVWNVWALEMQSGAASRLTSHRAGQPWGVSWFPDGHRICYAHEDEVVVLDTASGEARSYPSPRSDRLVRMPVVSPDGTRVVFQIDNDGAWLLELTDGTMREVLADPTAENFAWSRDGRQIIFHDRSGQWGFWSLPTSQ
jgi:hypothetical protein